MLPHIGGFFLTPLVLIRWKVFDIEGARSHRESLGGKNLLVSGWVRSGVNKFLPSLLVVHVILNNVCLSDWEFTR